MAALAVAAIASPHAEADAFAGAAGGLCVLAAIVALRIHWPISLSDESSDSRGWLLVVGGTLVLAIGDIIAVATRNAATRTFPLGVALASVVGAPYLIVGLLALIRPRVRSSGIDHLFEASLAPLTVLFLISTLLPRPAPHGTADAVAMLAALVVPTLDLVALVLTVRLLFVAWATRPARPFVLVVAAAALRLAADIERAAGPLHRGHVPVHVATAPLLVGLAVWVAAALAPLPATRMDPSPPATSGLQWWRLALAMGAVLAGPTALVAQAASDRGIHVTQLTVGTTVLATLAVAYLVRLVEERARIAQLALHDDLTGLPNRLLFSDRVAAALAQAPRTGQTVAVLFLDLDRFKNINDSLGHAAGNELLRLVGRRLRQCVRAEDTVARFGGDEFTLLLPLIADPDGAVAVAEKIITAFAEPFAVNKRELFVSPSIGIAVYPSDGDDVDTLLKNADSAMYRAKERGRNTYQLYTADMNARAKERLTLESSLHTALERGQLVLHYQPKIDLRTGRVVGMEALVRWQHPLRGLVHPAEFIPLAEDTGLIVPLGEWALESACRQTKEWQDGGFPRLTVAVNLSARQFQQQRVEDMVARTLRQSGLEPSSLELELTESLVFQDPEAITATLRDIKAMGVRCSIDDFGTGYSGLSYLTRFPIDRLKIDKLFVEAISRGDDDARLVAAVIALAHGLRLEVVAEGVETHEQLEFLWEHGCDEMQGYLFSRPLPAAEFEQLLMLEEISPGPGRLHLPRRPINVMDVGEGIGEPAGSST